MKLYGFDYVNHCRLLRTGTLLAALLAGVSGCILSPNGLGFRPVSNLPVGPLDSVESLSGSTMPVPTAPVRPPYGVLFTQYSAPLDYDFDSTPVISQNDRRRRVGTSESHFIWIFPFFPLLDFGSGDVSLEAASRNGDLQTVHYADYEYLNVLFIYTKMKITAYGE